VKKFMVFLLWVLAGVYEKAHQPAKEIVVNKYKYFCPICNMPDNESTWCRCDQPTQEQLIELLRTIYADDTTTEKIKQLIEELFRP
jgi:hypothetical protein